jgi:HPt (histidine-containing phosphotransfer) domain-containing protein
MSASAIGERRTFFMEAQDTGSWSVAHACDDLGTEPTGFFDPGVLKSICGDNPEIINRLIGRFLNALERDLREIESAVIRRSSVDVRYQAHRILGAALSVGATELAGAVEHVGVAARGGDWDALGEEMGVLKAAAKRLRCLLPES